MMGKRWIKGEEKGRKEGKKDMEERKSEKKKLVEKNQKITLTSIIFSTLRRSPRTEYYQKTQCFQKVMVILT